MQAQAIPVLTSTIEPAALTLADWLAIARAADVNNAPKWGYYRWSENTSADLSALSLQDWEPIAEATEHSERWAYHRFKEQQ